MLHDVNGLAKHFTPETLRAYLLARATRTPDGCLIVRGYGSRRGTHQKVAGRAWAHIAAYAAFVGGYDPTLLVDHTCQADDCIEPSHLRQVTRAQNSRDRRQPPACRNGHPREPDTGTGGDRRGCRECNRLAQQRWRHRQAEEVAQARANWHAAPHTGADPAPSPTADAAPGTDPATLPRSDDDAR